MPVTTRLLSTTMLSGAVGGAFLSIMPATAADIAVKAPEIDSRYLARPQPAVDGVNGKIDGLGGTLNGKGIYGSRGALSVPLGSQFGLQIDAAAGSYDQDFFAAGGAHLFWRDPGRGLIGLYATHTHWDRVGGVRVSQFGGEAAAYFGRLTIEGVAGVEWGNSASGIVGNNVETYDVRTRFFDEIDISYYLLDNARLSIGHRYLGGRHAAAFGGEIGFALGEGRMASLFVEGRAGEQNYRGVWGGLKIYFGQRDKTLMQRHREDDPWIRLPETLHSAVNNRQVAPRGAGCVLIDGVCTGGGGE